MDTPVSDDCLCSGNCPLWWPQYRLDQRDSIYRPHAPWRWAYPPINPPSEPWAPGGGDYLSSAAHATFLSVGATSGTPNSPWSTGSCPLPSYVRAPATRTKRPPPCISGPAPGGDCRALQPPLLTKSSLHRLLLARPSDPGGVLWIAVDPKLLQMRLRNSHILN